VDEGEDPDDVAVDLIDEAIGFVGQEFAGSGDAADAAALRKIGE